MSLAELQTAFLDLAAEDDSVPHQFFFSLRALLPSNGIGKNNLFFFFFYFLYLKKVFNLVLFCCCECRYRKVLEEHRKQELHLGSVMVPLYELKSIRVGLVICLTKMP